MGEVVRLVINNQDREMEAKEFRGERVVTFRDMDELHQRPEGTASRNFLANRDKFIEGTDFFKLSPEEMRTTNFVERANPQGIVLVTESGYLMLCKSFTDDLAWTVQRALVNGYFRAKAAANTSPDMMSLDQVIAIAQSVVATAMQTKIAREEARQALQQSQETKAEVQQVRFQLEAMQAKAQEAEQELLDLPAPATTVPQSTTRDAVRRVVNAYCDITNVSQRQAYRVLYSEVKDRYSKDLRARARNKKTSALEIAEQLGMIEQVYALAYELFGPERKVG